MRAEFCDSIVGWRLLTIKCAALVSIPEAEAKAQLQDAMSSLRERLSPILFHGKQRGKHLEREAVADARLMQLCRDAMKFALSPRRCRKSFVCEFPMLNSPVTSAEAPQGWDGERGEQGDPMFVGCVISPALVKRPEYDRSRRLVLEKAHVLARKASS